METNRLFGSRLRAAGSTLVILVLLVLVRELGGMLIGDTLGWGTWVGLLSGFIGGIVMVAALDLLADVDDDEQVVFHQLQSIHVIYATLAGAVYPALVSISGLDAAWVRTFPEALVGGIALSIGMFIIALVAYVVVGAIRVDAEDLTATLALFVLYLLFGIIFGISMSLTRSFWFQLF